MANAIVGQSGGPTSVINSSLAGVFQACASRGAEHVYGMLHGIQGLLDEKVCDLSRQLSSSLDIELLKRTPSHRKCRLSGGIFFGMTGWFAFCNSPFYILDFVGQNPMLAITVHKGASCHVSL